MQRGFWCQTLRFEPQTVVVHLCIPRLWIRTRCSNSHRHQGLVIIGQFFRDEEKYLGCVLWMKSSWVSVTVCVAELDSGGSPSTAVTVDRREPRPTSEGNPTYWHPTIWTWSKISLDLVGEKKLFPVIETIVVQISEYKSVQRSGDYWLAAAAQLDYSDCKLSSNLLIKFIICWPQPTHLCNICLCMNGRVIGCCRSRFLPALMRDWLCQLVIHHSCSVRCKQYIIASNLTISNQSHRAATDRMTGIIKIEHDLGELIFSLHPTLSVYS